MSMAEMHAVRDDCGFEIDTALARSVIYDALTEGFRPPTADTLRTLTSGDALATLRAAAAMLDTQSSSPAEPILPAVLRLAEVAHLTREMISDSYQRLFGHTARGVVCPFETEYGGSDSAFRQPQELADIAGFYLAFGLRQKAEIEERVDHIGCQCEFMGFLGRKEALALERGRTSTAVESASDHEMLEETRRTSKTFLRDHIGRFGRAFASRLMSADPEGLHGRLGDVLFRLIGIECERWGVAIGAPTLELRSTTESDAPMACGTAQELIQIQRPT
jgi:TorA maturation chaperone TorD